MAELSPHTLHGWYALHQMFCIDRRCANALAADARAALARDTAAALAAGTAAGGWSAAYQLVGGRADIMFVHFRPTLDELASVARALRRSAAGGLLRLEYDFLSIAEAALYHATVEALSEAPAGSDAFRHRIAELAAAESAAPRMQQRLRPAPPDEWPYACFYAMSRRRAGGENWYTLPLHERDRLLHEHGLTGRRYAGRIAQIITGATGFSDGEWGVTLFARDPLELKRLVTEMRFDEASARYAEFGRFFTGIRVTDDDWI
jgi:hydrogen peroxide-dependent heme synthase